MGFKCPFCETGIPITPSAVQSNTICFSDVYGINLEHVMSSAGPFDAEDGKMLNDPYKIKVIFYLCPECKKVTILVEGGSALQGLKTSIHPRYICTQFPDYVPAPIKEDYEEACAIKEISPKASATLSRRCLQGIIRDYFGVVKKRLYDEIDTIKDRVDPDLWKSIDAVRNIGNIGAHMEKDINTIIDIDPNEAELLIKLIELLIKEWYVARHKRQELFSSIKKLDADTKAKRKKKSD